MVHRAPANTILATLGSGPPLLGFCLKFSNSLGNALMANRMMFAGCEMKAFPSRKKPLLDKLCPHPDGLQKAAQPVLVHSIMWAEFLAGINK